MNRWSYASLAGTPLPTAARGEERIDSGCTGMENMRLIISCSRLWCMNANLGRSLAGSVSARMVMALFSSESLATCCRPKLRSLVQLNKVAETLPSHM
jgi:hypothetical protein